MDKIINFTDVFKKSFLEGFSSSLAKTDVLISLGVTFVIAVGIFFFYKLTTKSVMYSKSFNISTAGLAIVTCVVIMAVRSNVVLSLGMVGALSIVRFRTAIKDPMDLVFLFWAIGVGIVSGAGNYFLAIVGSAVVAACILLFSVFPVAKNPYMLVACCSKDSACSAMLDELEKRSIRYKVKTKSTTAKGIEINLQLSVHDVRMELSDDLMKIDGMESVVVLSYDGEYIS